MTRKEFKEKLFSYCKELGYIINESTVDFEPFNCLFYMPCIQNFDDKTFHYTPIPSKGQNATTMRKIKINYNEGTLDIYKDIAKKWCIIHKEYKVKQKLEEIGKDFE